MKYPLFLKTKETVGKKRDGMIDRLIGNEQYVEHWSNKWADMLQVNGKFLGRQGAVSLRNWIEKEINKNTPMTSLPEKFSQPLVPTRKIRLPPIIRFCEHQEDDGKYNPSLPGHTI